MLPSKTDQRWKLLLTGKIKHQFKTFSGSMLINRLSKILAKDASPVTMDKCINEAYIFFQKYEKIFSNDLNTIFN